MNQVEDRQPAPHQCQVKRGDRSPDYRPPLLTRILRILWKYRYLIAICVALLLVLIIYLIVKLLYLLGKLLIRRITLSIKRLNEPRISIKLPTTKTGTVASTARRARRQTRKRKVPRRTDERTKRGRCKQCGCVRK